MKEYGQVSTTEVAKPPLEGQWFKVNPLAIDQGLFQKERDDETQEELRQLILEAFTEVKSNPEKYGRKFKTMLADGFRFRRPVSEFKKLACKIGDHMADWVEQALEWAQRIANGESWENICNKPDKPECWRAVVWKKGFTRVFEGRFLFVNASGKKTLGFGKPLVVSYDE